MVYGLGERLQKQRQLLNLSQKDVASAIGVSASVISNYESSERVPSVENIMALAILYRCSVDYLLGIKNDTGIKIDLTMLNDSQIQLLQNFLLSLNQKK